ncbi:MAG TPA: TlpA disulfide reductase family protein [Pyrinomonadaceae bacterium]|nr:TlpA disulfide reductase family protein [Pyrinomonadaceae bacterium]
MKRVSTFALLLTLSLALCAFARGQAGVRPRTAEGAEKDAAKASEAQTLYEEASRYAQSKFDDFRKKNVPYDPLLEQKTLQEQRDLALQHAARLAARAPLRGTDLYYSGLLYSLAGKGEGALDSMRKFLADAEPAPADLKQRARSVAAQQAAQLGLLEEAERALADYSKSEPRSVADLHRMNLLVASAHVKKKDYARAAAPAGEAYKAALEYARTAADPVQRDSTIYGAGSFYVSVLVKAGRRAEGVRVAQEMRARAFAIPSARLYGQATELVLRQGEPFGPPPEVAGLEPPPSPEIAVAELIGQGPVKLSELRGKVVLIDFWATWCTFCVKTMPRLNALHEKYKDRGLVIIGLNEFEGNIKGEPATRAQELEYFRQFKRQMKIPYDFAVAADARNDGPFGVAGLPTAVLVDRRGRVRFLTIGASEEEAEVLKGMILKLLDEKP